MTNPGPCPPLDDLYLLEAERRARRFAGTYDQGTSGTLAADLLRVLRDRDRILNERHATPEPATMTSPTALGSTGPMIDPEDLDVETDDESRLALGHADQTMSAFETAWQVYKNRAEATQALLQPTAQPAATDQAPPAEQLLLASAATVRERRASYGPPAEHFAITIGLLNAAFAAKLRARLSAGLEPFELTDWPLIMNLDKVARYMGPGRSADVAVDLAGYAGCLRECEAERPSCTPVQ